jgi:rhodanese-related sulfurtransferase
MRFDPRKNPSPKEPSMSPFLHSLPWTLALTLAAQSAENEASKALNSKAPTAQESVIQTGAVKDKAWYEARFPDIARKDLQENMKSGTVVLVDANGSDSYAEGHLPGALDFEANEAGLAGKLPTDKNALIVAYCGGPGCRAWNRAALKLDELGYTNVRHYKGGLKEWKSSGGKFEKPAKSG